MQAIDDSLILPCVEYVLGALSDCIICICDILGEIYDVPIDGCDPTPEGKGKEGILRVFDTIKNNVVNRRK